MKGITKEEAYALFESACNEITDSNVIMTQQPLLNLMKLIAYNDIINVAVRECYKGIYYEQLLKQSLVKGDDGRYTFVLPSSNRAIVALIAKLLYEFAMGQQSLEKMLKALYPKQDVRGAYTSFCENIILPFKESFRQVCMSDAVEEEPEIEERVVVNINSAVVAEVGAIAGDLRSELVGDNRLSSEQREELICLVDGLCEVLEADLPKLVRPAWLGIRYAFGAAKKCASTVARLQKALGEYMLI
ncbi:MAG: hypothetical protein IJX70_02520 [Clostridia bacterium]|nr:hypothetical protein [Clostridia bacterium]